MVKSVVCHHRGIKFKYNVLIYISCRKVGKQTVKILQRKTLCRKVQKTGKFCKLKYLKDSHLCIKSVDDVTILMSEGKKKNWKNGLLYFLSLVRLPYNQMIQSKGRNPSFWRSRVSVSRSFLFSKHSSSNPYYYSVRRSDVKEKNRGPWCKGLISSCLWYILSYSRSDSHQKVTVRFRSYLTR